MNFLTRLLDRSTSKGDVKPASYGTNDEDTPRAPSTSNDAEFYGAANARSDEHDELEQTEMFPYVENAKYLLISCVVWAHAIEDFLSTSTAADAETWSVRRTKLEVLEPLLPWLRALYFTLSSFSMPLFTVLAGFQSKTWLEIARGHDSKAGLMLSRVRGSTSTLLSAWALWQALYVAVSYSDVKPLQWWSPVGVTWFLLALWVWRSSVLLIGPFSDVLVSVIVCAVAILVGFTDTPTTTNGLTFLDWQRTCTFALYFYVGLVLMRRERLNDVLVRMEESKTPWLRYVVGVLGLGAVFGGFMLSDHLGEPFSEVQDWLLVAKPYGFTKWYDPVVDALLRVLLYVSVAFASVSFMCLVPMHRHWFTELGSRTIAAYLLHRVFLTVYTDVAAKFWDDDDMDVALEITLGVFVLPLIVSQLCLTRSVTKLCAPLLSPARRIGALVPTIFHVRPNAYALDEGVADQGFVDSVAEDTVETPLAPDDRDVARRWRPE